VTLRLVPVLEWKQQLKKQLVRERIDRRLAEGRWVNNFGAFKSHTEDAVGIGLHVQGVPMSLVKTE
jgi:hypothetical protein